MCLCLPVTASGCLRPWLRRRSTIAPLVPAEPGSFSRQPITKPKKNQAEPTLQSRREGRGEQDNSARTRKMCAAVQHWNLLATTTAPQTKEKKRKGRKEYVQRRHIHQQQVFGLVLVFQPLIHYSAIRNYDDVFLYRSLLGVWRFKNFVYRLQRASFCLDEPVFFGR